MASQFVRPGVLTATGHPFRYPSLEGALRHVLGRTPPRPAGNLSTQREPTLARIPRLSPEATNPETDRSRIADVTLSGRNGLTRRRIAVIGGGISGLTAGYILARTDEVTLFEAADRLGGHADTHLVDEPGGRTVAVDTGFIVYNERTYPLLTRLFAELGVETQASEMSMSVSCSGCGVQYAGKRGPAGLGAGVAGGGRPYLQMLAEVPRFHRAARRLLATTPPREAGQR